MSFKNWYGTLLPFEAKALTREEIFQAGAASRDAEVARLKTVPMRYRRMAFNAQLQDEVAELVAALERMRVADGTQEFHIAWELAKDVLTKVSKP